MNVNAPIVIVTEGGAHVWALVNAVADALGPVTVIREQPESKRGILLARARRLGWVEAIGQLGTMILIRFGKRLFAGRVARIVVENKLMTEPRRDQAIIDIPTANSPEFLRAVEDLRPGVILLAGCRLLRAETLASLKCPVLNYHAGITPKYRGMNGSYWALAQRDPGNFGGTVHLVDTGVDTGAVLRHARGAPSAGDNVMLYALRVAAISREACVDAVRSALAGNLEPIRTDLPSRQWYHPTIWRYLWTGMTRGVW